MKEIFLNHGYVALVDDKDYPELSKWNWRVSKRPHTCYAIRKDPGKNANIYMHRQVLGFPDGQADHINGNGLDNRRSNLRVTDHLGNASGFISKRPRSLSRFRGVTFHAPSRRWHAQLVYNKKRYSGRYHATEEQAARVRDEIARRVIGEFAHLNFPA